MQVIILIVVGQIRKRWRFVATLDGGKTSVGLQAVGPEHPFYNLEGSNNIVLLTTERYKEYPMMIQGYAISSFSGVFSKSWLEATTTTPLSCADSMISLTTSSPVKASTSTRSISPVAAALLFNSA